LAIRGCSAFFFGRQQAQSPWCKTCRARRPLPSGCPRLPGPPSWPLATLSFPCTTKCGTRRSYSCRQRSRGPLPWPAQQVQSQVPPWKHAGRAADHPYSVARPHIHGRGPQEVPTWKHAGRGIHRSAVARPPLFVAHGQRPPSSPRTETRGDAAALLFSRPWSPGLFFMAGDHPKSLHGNVLGAAAHLHCRPWSLGLTFMDTDHLPHTHPARGRTGRGGLLSSGRMRPPGPPSGQR
jgi:hypothetical protein